MDRIIKNIIQSTHKNKKGKIENIYKNAFERIRIFSWFPFQDMLEILLLNNNYPGETIKYFILWKMLKYLTASTN